MNKLLSNLFSWHLSLTLNYKTKNHLKYQSKKLRRSNKKCQKDSQVPTMTTFLRLVNLNTSQYCNKPSTTT